MTRSERPVGHVVSHTHWDRAWYWTFEQTRVRLVALLDQLLELMLTTPDYRHFVLDGQLAMVEDYLAVRPERRETLRRLVASGRLLLGPWFVLPDLFIPHGESLIRNLRAGARKARSVGRVMRIGYLPDPFGLPAQLPQLLQLHGIDGVLFARGVGDEGERLGADFIWQAPDGTAVLATHQAGGGYCNLARLGQREGSSAAADHEVARRQVLALVERLSPLCPARQLLLNNGCDHLPPQPELPRLLTQLNRQQQRVRLVHSTPLRYQRAIRQAVARGWDPPRHRGELRGGRYANILSGVLSARVDVKLAHHAAERLLLDWVERWGALVDPRERHAPQALVDHAWDLVLLCQPHDDICGCSIDTVHEDDLVRLRQAHEVADELRQRLLSAVAAATGGRAAVVNPHPWPVRQLVSLPGWRGARRPPSAVLPTQTAGDDALTLVDLPPCGAVPLEPCATASRNTVGGGLRARRDRRGVRIDSPELSLRIANNGAIGLRHRASGLAFRRLLWFEDDGDVGDTYDWSPPREQRVFRELTAPRVTMRERGPLRATVEIVAALELPVSATADRQRRRARTRRVPLRLRITLAAGQPAVLFEIEVDNRVIDHRLRVATRAPFVAERVLAAAPFQLIARPTRPSARPGWQQPPVATFPFSDTVLLQGPRGGIACVAPGLREAEARPRRGGTDLLVTLLRSVGWLSRDDLATRRDAAGPCWPVEGARMLGENRFSLGLLPFAGSWSTAEVQRRAAEIIAPPLVVRNEDACPVSDVASTTLAEGLLKLRGAGVELSAITRGAGGAVEVRLTNLRSRRVVASIVGPWRRAEKVDLRGKRISAKVDLRALSLGRHEIATFRLYRERSPSSRSNRFAPATSAK